MSSEPFWPGLDDEDPVPMPMPVENDRPSARSEAIQQARRSGRMPGHSSNPGAGRDAETYKRICGASRHVAGGDDQHVSDAAARIGIAVFDKSEEVEEQRRRSATLARSAALRDKQEQRWGVVRALLEADPTLSAEAMTRTLRNSEKKVREPPMDTEN